MRSRHDGGGAAGPEDPAMTWAEWLRGRGVRLWEIDGVPWMLYRHALIPAAVAPLYLTPPPRALAAALRRSGAWLARFSSAPLSEEAPWWYVVCDASDPARLSANARSQVQRGLRRCEVRRIDADWLAEHGYDCYAAAFARYGGLRPRDRVRFAAATRATSGGPQEYWGVFRDQRLAGYCQCIVEGRHVCTNVFKYDPALLKDYASYALVSRLVAHYVAERGLLLNNSTRAVAHDSDVQDFLLRLGFRRQYAQLGLVYRPWLGAAVRALYPARHLFEGRRAPAPVASLRALLFQESLRRAQSTRAVASSSRRS
jgi:hypothetical protein